jgi:CRP-like cAMP-binding protein
MLDLADVPFLADLPPDALTRVRRHTEQRPAPTGSVICRRGDQGRAVYVVAQGGVLVETGAGPRRVFLGPGEMFGEMSVVSGMPVSATVVAVQPTVLHRIAGPAFVELIVSEPALQLALTQMLARRIRERTGTPATGGEGTVALLVADPGSELLCRAIRALEREIGRHAPATSLAAAPEAIARWRESAGAGQCLIAVADPAQAARIGARLARGDVVLALEEGSAGRAGAIEHGGARDRGNAAAVGEAAGSLHPLLSRPPTGAGPGAPGRAVARPTSRRRRFRRRRW